MSIQGYTTGWAKLSVADPYFFTASKLKKQLDGGWGGVPFWGVREKADLQGIKLCGVPFVRALSQPVFFLRSPH